MPEEQWTEFITFTGGSDQDYPQEKEMKKAKWLSEEALQIAEKRREAKSKGSYFSFLSLIPVISH